MEDIASLCSARGIHHVGIAVRDLEQGVALYRRLFGLEPGSVVELPQHGVRAVMLAAGSQHLELLQPLGPESSVARFLERRGEGLHHLALEVPDIRAALKALRESGVELIDQEPRQGLAGLVAFIHPRWAHGVLTELVEPYQEY